MQVIPARIKWEEAKSRCAAFLASLGVSLDGKDVLLAVSGGMDSMCMLALLASTRARLSVAHVNYGLRGAESDADTALVKSTCTGMGITVYITQVEIKSLSEGSDESLQQAGRRIRYEWFAELCNANHYDYICTAHHQDDAAETFFVNLLRGTGLKGLAGIPVMRGNILRPMLCFTREEIHDLVETQHIAYRHDASNFERDYLRNRIRHDIIPLFQKERAHFIFRMYATQQRLNSEYALFEEHLHHLKSEILKEGQEAIVLDRVKLMMSTSPAIVLLYLIQKYGFSLTQCHRIVSQGQRSGTKYLSSSHELMIDRNQIHVMARTVKSDEIAIEIKGDGCYVLPNGELQVNRAHVLSGYSADPNTENIDGSKVTGDLVLRHWRHGDFFYPFGGAGRQKLQDFFTNEKVSTIEKANCWLLTAGDDIVWVVGMRLDHRYRITTETSDFVKLEWNPE